MTPRPGEVEDDRVLQHLRRRVRQSLGHAIDEGAANDFQLLP